MAKTLLAGSKFRKSRNDYDWLGAGIYFWEANPVRGLAYARELKKNRRGKGAIKNPTVVGAAVDLGLCLDLTTDSGIRQVKIAYRRLKEAFDRAGIELPKNHKDGLRRNLDCAVIGVLHKIRVEAGQPPIDTIKGVFIEGGPIYDRSGYYKKTHIQICVCNPNCINGVFRVPKRHLR